MKVALLHPCFWPEVRRGSERFARDLADGLIARGHSPRLITSHPGPPSRAVEDGLPIMRHWRPPEGPLRARLYTEYLTHLPFTYASLLSGSDELVHPLYPTDALAAIRWSRRTGRPTVFTAPGPARRETLAARRLRLEAIRRAATECTVTVAISRYARDSLWRWLGVESRVIQQGADLDVFRPSAERAEAPTIFCAAAIDDQRKRVDLIVDAYRLVRRERPDAELVLTGARTDARPEEAGVSLLEPTLDRRELAARYSRAWVSVLAARDEGFGLVVAESLACGTPAVGTDNGAIPELLTEPEVGGLFPPDDSEALAKALLEALELAAAPGTAGACRAHAERFSTARCVAGYEALYGELVGGA